MPGEVHITPDGRLLVQDEATGEKLVAAAGNYHLLPTHPDTILLLRVPSQGGPFGVPRVALSGDLAAIALPEIVEFLHQGRRTGTLRVVSPGSDRAIVIKDGMIRGATSDDPSDALAECCLRLGMLTRGALAGILASNPPPGRVGRALVEAGLLQSHDLFKATQFQVTEIFHSMLLGREGAFVFLDEPIEERSGGVQLNTQALLMDSVRRIDEMAQFRIRLPSGELFVVRRKPPTPALEPEEKALYDLCSGELTILDLAREMRISEFEATRHVYNLMQGGFVAASPTAQAAPGEAKKNDPGDVARVFNLIFKEVLSEVAKHELAHEFIGAANTALQSEAAPRSPFLKGITFSQEGVLDGGKLLANVNREPAEPAERARMLFQALSEVMFFLLFQAGEILGPTEDEQLATRVKELLATVDPG